MNPSTGTALTNGSGVASITLLPAGSTSGATTVTATAQVSNTAVTNSLGYSVGASTVNITTPVFGVGTSPLSAFGTTSVSVTVTSNGAPITTPQTVTFSSACASNGKAALSSVITVNGVATGSYRDIGCGGTDTVTATVSGGAATSSATLTVLAPEIGSITYVSANPTNISLQGTGGTTTSLVTFKVLDTGGLPISGKTVTFGLSTTTGGISLAAPNGISDGDGLVVATVSSGTMNTPVRVTATTPGATAGVTLTSQSNELSVTTGIPDNSDFTIAATVLNIDGFHYDGSTTVITARLADHFKNPAPDGTTVNFTSEAGSIIGTCNTTGGACSTTLTSMGTRPNNGRVTVLAYAIGEETFTDTDGNNVADLVSATGVNEMFDVNGDPTDLPDAWLDVNETGTHDTGELYFNLVAGAPYTAADGKFSGVLCTAASSAGTCASSKTVYVRSSLVIAFSSTTPAISISPASITASTTKDYVIKVVDENGNAMPAGTKISITASTGTTLTGDTSYIVPSTNGCLTDSSADCVAANPHASTSFGNLTVKIAAAAAGSITVTTATPAPDAIVNSGTLSW